MGQGWMGRRAVSNHSPAERRGEGGERARADFELVSSSFATVPITFIQRGLDQSISQLISKEVFNELLDDPVRRFLVLRRFFCIDPLASFLDQMGRFRFREWLAREDKEPNIVPVRSSTAEKCRGWRRRRADFLRRVLFPLCSPSPPLSSASSRTQKPMARLWRSPSPSVWPSTRPSPLRRPSRRSTSPSRQSRKA